MLCFSYKELLGSLSIFGSAFCFYLSTAAIRWSHAEVDLSSTFFVFSRFFLGFVLFGSILLFKGRKRIRPRRYDLLLIRAVTNTVAVFCFFKAVEVTTVAEANILNMTYPIFVALFSWIFFKEQQDYIAYLMAILAVCGIVLVMSPGNFGSGWNNLWGLSSGIVASWAIITLNSVRQYNDTDTVLLFVFGVGMVLLYAGFHEDIYIPTHQELFYLMLCGGFGILGQYLLTLGFRFVTAVEGSIISSTRILLAAVLGPYVVGDPAMTWVGWIGAFFIFGANAYLAARKAGRGWGG